MTIEEAIKTAIELEGQVRDVYRSAMEETTDPVGMRIFRLLGDEEQKHLDYLRNKLSEWERTGTITAERLETTIPSEEVIREGIGKLGNHMVHKDLRGEPEFLSRAFDVEVKTSNFYNKMVTELTREGKQLFANFVEIEQGHLTIVRAEIDYLTRTGYWFDFKEFDME
jgi:rubrerythrin